MLAILDGDDQQVLVHTAVLIKGGQACHWVLPM